MNKKLAPDARIFFHTSLAFTIEYLLKAVIVINSSPMPVPNDQTGDNQ